MDTSGQATPRSSEQQAIPPNPHFSIHPKPRPKVTAEQAYAQIEASAGNMEEESPVVQGWPGGPSKTAKWGKKRG